jgi:hypothetical protein
MLLLANLSYGLERKCHTDEADRQGWLVDLQFELHSPDATLPLRNVHICAAFAFMECGYEARVCVQQGVHFLHSTLSHSVRPATCLPLGTRVLYVP